MENVNPFVPVLPNKLHARVTKELNELHAISAMIDSRLKNIDHTRIIIPPTAPFKQLLNDFMNPYDVFEMNDLESDGESVDTPLVSPFLDLDDKLGDGEVLNELDEYGMDFYVFVGSFTYVPDFVVLEDIGEVIVSGMSEVVMGRPFRDVTQLEYDCVDGPECQVDEDMKEWLTLGHVSIGRGVTILSKKRRKNYLQFMETASGILPDGVATPATVIFDKEKPESS
ncbi:hypothetical protein Tco_0590945 [Tanacetum coccineum]